MNPRQLFAQRKKPIPASLPPATKEAVANKAAEIQPPEGAPKVEKKPTLGVNHSSVGFIKKKLGVSKKREDASQPALTIQQAPVVAPAIPIGSFDSGDLPERVIGAKMTNGAIMVTLEWKPRPITGVKPSESVFTNDIVKERCPRLLVDFYESRINAKSRSSAPSGNEGNH